MLPLVSIELVEHLESMFPDRLPTDWRCSVEELRILQGAKSVVDYLKSLYEHQQQEQQEKQYGRSFLTEHPDSPGKRSSPNHDKRYVVSRFA